MAKALTLKTDPLIEKMARTGLIAKGILYVLIGLLAIMAAFRITNQSDTDADQKGAFSFIRDWPAGNWIVMVLALGLFSYSIWRFIQAFRYGKGKDPKKKWAKKIRYLSSGLVYLSFALSAAQLVLTHKNDSGNGNSKEHLAQKIMEQPFGQWLLGAVALGFLATGIYQAWYGVSGKYRKHVQECKLDSGISSVLVTSGVIGYLSRGVVWVILAWLMMRAALHANSKEAGDTGEAFQFIHSGPLGTIILSVLGLGLIAYGVFNFIRAGKEEDNVLIS